MITTRPTVASIMSPNVLLAHIDYRFSEISRLFFQMDIHHLPIVGANDQLLGIISSNDILRAYNRYVIKLEDTDEKTLDNKLSIFELMTPNPVCVAPDTPISEASKIFIENHIQSLPVVENGEIVGIVTTRDVVRYCSEAHGE